MTDFSDPAARLALVERVGIDEYCTDPRHAIACPLPCRACAEECNRSPLAQCTVQRADATGAIVHTGSLHAFLRVNGFDRAERRAIIKELRDYHYTTVGGGAAPAFWIFV